MSRIHAPAAVIAWLVALSALAEAPRVLAQDQSAPTDSDPTRPILFSLRPEFYRVTDDGWRMQTIARYDQAMFRNRPLLGGRRGMLLRLEMPIMAGQVPGVATAGGLGDGYAQVLLIPHFTGRFAFAAGTGVFLPSAGSTILGTGKWTVAPAAIPIWFTRGVGMIFVKAQNLTSFAGDRSRPDVNMLLVTPTAIRTFRRRWWVLVDVETKTDWQQNGRTGVKSGIQIGHVMAGHVGLWAKPEFWWGKNQDGKWNLKTGFVLYR